MTNDSSASELGAESTPLESQDEYFDSEISAGTGDADMIGVERVGEALARGDHLVVLREAAILIRSSVDAVRPKGTELTRFGNEVIRRAPEKSRHILDRFVRNVVKILASNTTIQRTDGAVLSPEELIARAKAVLSRIEEFESAREKCSHDR